MGAEHHAHRREDDLGREAVGTLFFEARLRVVPARMQLVPVPAIGPFDVGATRCGDAPERAVSRIGRIGVDDDGRAHARKVRELGRAVAEPRVDVGVGRFGLGDVRIGGDVIAEHGMAHDTVLSFKVATSCSSKSRSCSADRS